MEKYERLFKVGKKKVRASKVEDWFAAVETEPVQYAFIPDKHKTYALTKVAVSLYGWNLRWVPDEQKTEEIVDLAIIEDCDSVLHVENPDCRHQVAAVHLNPYIINLMPDPCDDAVKEVKRRSPDNIGRMFVTKT